MPERIAAPLPDPTAAEAIDTPGAVTVGFRAESPPRGPPELNEAYFSNPGFARSLGLIVKLSAARRASPADLRTPRNGTVTSYFTRGSVSGISVIGPSNGGSESSVLTMTTASKPAIWP